MKSLLAGTVAHGARGGRGVSTSHSRSCISGTPRYFPELPGSGSHNSIITWNVVVDPLSIITLLTNS